MLLQALFAAANLPECAHVAVPEPTEQAVAYFHGGMALWGIDVLWSLFIPLLILFSGLSAKLGMISERWGKKLFFSLAIYLGFYVAISALLHLPLDFYTHYLRQHEYGLSTQSLGRWFGNFGKENVVLWIGLSLFVWIFYLLLKKSPRRWWLYSSIVSIVLLVFAQFVQPIWVDPLFNNFGPMKNRQLEKEILGLAHKAGIHNGRVFEVDKSADTKMYNAYVIGFGSSNRIVLWDTVTEGMPKEQILFVMGHEMGHYVLHHVEWLFLIFAVESFLIFYLTYRSATYLVKRFERRFGFKQLYSIASFPLLLFLLSLFLLLLDPLNNLLSRHFEHEADRFGLEITQNNRAAAEAFISLQQKNLAVPRPGLFYTIWRGSHPSLGERIDFCNHYCPWSEGEPLQYQSYFKNAEQAEVSAAQ